MIQPSRPLAADVVRDHYQELDRLYRVVWGEHVHHGLWRTGRETDTEAVERLVEVVAASARLAPGMAVCDIGSGYGASARYLARRYAVRATALTIVPAQFEYAVAAGPAGGNPCYLLRDWLDNQLPDESFDAAYAVESTEHMADKGTAFAEARRVLRPGGRLVVCAWLAAERPKTWEVRHLLEPICREGRLPGMGTETEYRAMMAGAGLTVETADDLSRQVRRTWAICLRRVLGRVASDAEARAFLLSRASRNRVFLATMARIWLAYRVEAMRYVVLTAVKA